MSRCRWLIAILCLLLLVVSLSTPPQETHAVAPATHGGIHVYLDDVTVEMGDPFSTILHVNNVPGPGLLTGIGGYSIQVTYDPSKLSFPPKNGSPPCGVTGLALGAPTGVNCFPNIPAGTINVVDAETPLEGPSGNVNLLQFSGTAIAGVPTTAVMTLAVVDILDPDANSYPNLQITNGTITIIEPVAYTLTVSSVAGNGTVTSNPAGINCPGDCTQDYDSGTAVALTATPAAGWAFASWGGDCAGQPNPCNLSMNANKNVSATFLQIFTLAVACNGAGVVLPQACATTQGYTSGTVVTLAATPALGWHFQGWSGDCAGTGNCQLTMNANKSVTATFVPLYDLAVSCSGSGSVAPQGCGATQSYPSGTVVTLTATPADGWHFQGWSGDCAGTGNCQLTMNANKSVTATFVPLYTLIVMCSGSGSVSPQGCGASQSYPSGTALTLTATAANGWHFQGWSGACAGPGDCQVTMDANKSVTATFVPLYTLTVICSGSGSVSPQGCGTLQLYPSGSVVTLTATADQGWEFQGWSGDCSGAGACQVTVDFNESVIATFVPAPNVVTARRTALDADGAAGAAAAILEVYDPVTGLPLPALIGAYQATFFYPGGGMSVLDCRLKAPFDTGACNVNDPGGVTLFNGVAALGAPWPVDPVAFLALRLTGCVDDLVTVNLVYTFVSDLDGTSLAIDQPAPRTHRRGNAKADEALNMADVLYIAQHNVGFRPPGDGAGEVDVVSAASVKHDGAVDLVTIADALEMAQYLVGLRDGCFNLLGVAAPPIR